MKYFCEKCGEEVDETLFTIDKNGEVCDNCIKDYEDMQNEPQLNTDDFICEPKK